MLDQSIYQVVTYSVITFSILLDVLLLYTVSYIFGHIFRFAQSFLQNY